MSEIIDFVHDLKFDDLPDSVVDAAIRALMDTLGVAMAGSTTKLSRIIHDHAASQFAAGTNEAARLWNDGRLVSPAGAALANGMTIDSIDAHDGFKPAKGHVGCGVVPALIALSQARAQFDAREFLTCLTMGYEIGSRAAMALHATADDYHTSGAWVALATACIASRYLGLTVEQTRQAVGISEYHGPRSQMMRAIDHPTMVKDGSGWGSMAGVSAAYLAKDGFTGAPAVTMESGNVQTYWADLGSRWYIGEQYIKLYPVCRWAQPPVAAVLQLKQEHAFDAADIERIDVTTFAEAVSLSKRHPANTEEAQYSLPYPVAAALVHGRIGVAEVSDHALGHCEVNALERRIFMQESDTFNREFPARRFARVTITLKNGARFESPDTEAVGDPENPISPAGISQKFFELTLPVLGQKGADRLHNLIRNSNRAESIKPLIESL